MSLYGQSLYGQSTYGSFDVAPPPPPPGGPPPWLDDRIEYHPPGGGDPLVAMFHRDPSVSITQWRGLAIEAYDGLDGASRQTHSLAAPGQYGATPTGSEWQPQHVSLALFVHGGDDADRRARIAAIERACFVEPGVPQQGILRVYRHGRPPMEAEAIPEGEPGREIDYRSPRVTVNALDFLVPSGLWRSITSRAVFLGGIDGGEYVMDMDGEHVLDAGEYVLSGNASTDVTYEGVVPAPIIVDFSGAMEGPRLIVAGPGSRSEEIAVDVELQAGERLQVTTGRGQVSARLFSGGVWSDAGDLIDNVATRPWLLRPGLQTVSLAATVNTSGTARLAWHDWFPSP